MRRRDFIAKLMLPLLIRPVSAQEKPLPLVAFVTPSRGLAIPRYLEAIRRGLLEMGFVEGRNVVVEHHDFERRFQRLPQLLADLVQRRVAVICTITNAVAVPLKASGIPFVFGSGLDPVAMGLVQSLNRPGGNATGVFFPVTALDPKRLELLRELIPELRLVAMLVNPANPNADVSLGAVAHSVGLELLVLKVHNADEIDTAFASITQHRAGAVLVTSDGLFETCRQELFNLAARNRIPVIYPWREYTEAGGLLSYGNSFTDAARLIGAYAGRILKGEKPGDLPVEMPTKFEFVINLKTARTLGLTIPPTLLARADEVIE
jgi:putative ABC transport system substrate-binding protein